LRKPRLLLCCGKYHRSVFDLFAGFRLREPWWWFQNLKVAEE